MALLNEASGFIYPSIFEGFGIAPLEALSCGTPVAVSDIPVMREVLGDAAIYFDPEDERRIADVMMGLNRTNKVVEQKTLTRYSWRLSAERLKEKYRKNSGVS